MKVCACWLNSDISQQISENVANLHVVFEMAQTTGMQSACCV